jgi:signal transduction histidine kinase
MTIECPQSLMLYGDPGKLGQVLTNLITNAIDAYEERGIANGRIALHAAQGRDGIRLRVTDSAGGIPSAILPHIFEELYTTKGPGRGTGLGLWIARALVEQGFGGTLEVLSCGGSSSFIADFPAAVCGAPPVERKPALLAVPEREAIAAAS